MSASLWKNINPYKNNNNKMEKNRKKKLLFDNRRNFAKSEDYILAAKKRRSSNTDILEVINNKCRKSERKNRDYDAKSNINDGFFIPFWFIFKVKNGNLNVEILAPKKSIFSLLFFVFVFVVF